jgi:FMN phosphatase YigB (HAD superfamily)
MPNGTSGKVGGVYVDLFKTVLEPKLTTLGQDPDWGIAQIYANAYGLSLDQEFFDQWKQQVRYWREQLKDIQGVTDFWVAVNHEVGMNFAPGMGSEVHRRLGRVIHDELITNPDIYEVHDDMRQALAKLRELSDRFLIIAATNAQNHTVTNMLQHFGIENYFDLRYTAEFLGARKPFPAFWTSMGYWLGQKIKVSRPVVRMVGASLTTDAPAVKPPLEIPTHLLDRGGDKQALLESGSAKSGLPEWVHNRYAKNQIFCHRDPLQLAEEVVEQLTLIEQRIRTIA